MDMGAAQMSNKNAWTCGSPIKCLDMGQSLCGIQGRGFSAGYGGEASLLDTIFSRWTKIHIFFLDYHITRNRGVHIHDYWDCPKELNTRGGQQSQHVQSQNRGGEPHYKAVCKDFYPKTGVHRSTNIYLVKLSKQVKRRPGSRLAKLEQKLDAT